MILLSVVNHSQTPGNIPLSIHSPDLGGRMYWADSHESSLKHPGLAIQCQLKIVIQSPTPNEMTLLVNCTTISGLSTEAYYIKNFV